MELNLKNRRGNSFVLLLPLLKIIFVSVILFFSVYASAQNIERINIDSSVVPPAFKGGGSAWLQFLAKNIYVPVLEDNNAPSGKYLVTVSFMVTANGKISDIIIEKDAGYGTGKDAKKVLQKCPRWIPATRNGLKIPYRLTQNIVDQKV